MQTAVAIPSDSGPTLIRRSGHSSPLHLRTFHGPGVPLNLLMTDTPQSSAEQNHTQTPTAPCACCLPARALVCEAHLAGGTTAFRRSNMRFGCAFHLPQ